MDIRLLLAQWGYLALFVGVVFGNVGLPLPETCLLWAAGVFVWQGHWSFVTVLAVAVAAAVLGDNGGYWLGRRYGPRLLAHYGTWVGLTARRATKAQTFLTRYGAIGVFGARFVTGLRFLAGPVAGSMGLPPRRFFAANVLGALVYVPLTVAEGYGAAYGVGRYLHHLHRVAVQLQSRLLLGAVLGLLMIAAWRVWQCRRRRNAPVVSRPEAIASGR